MTIALIIALPVSIALTGFIVLKSVQLGLRWQIQTKQEQEPTLQIPNPIKEVKENKQTAINNEILDEWLNGPKEGG